jgi:hypothetical protein
MRQIRVRSQPKQIKTWTGGVAQGVERLPRKPWVQYPVLQQEIIIIIHKTSFTHQHSTHYYINTILTYPLQVGPCPEHNMPLQEEAPWWEHLLHKGLQVWVGHHSSVLICENHHPKPDLGTICSATTPVLHTHSSTQLLGVPGILVPTISKALNSKHIWLQEFPIWAST